jgi:glycine/D-amino acid oxidase-like deaminating enzyme
MPQKIIIVGAGIIGAALAFRLAQTGAQVWLCCGVMGVLERGGHVQGVMMAEWPVRADHVVLATGAGTPALLAPLGILLQRQSGCAALFLNHPLACGQLDAGYWIFGGR